MTINSYDHSLRRYSQSANTLPVCSAICMSIWWYSRALSSSPISWYTAPSPQAASPSRALSPSLLRYPQLVLQTGDSLLKVPEHTVQGAKVTIRGTSSL